MGMVNLVSPVVQWSSAMARTTYYLSQPVTQCLLATSCDSFYRVLLGGSRNRMRNLPDLMVMPVMPVMMMMMMIIIIINDDDDGGDGGDDGDHCDDGDGDGDGDADDAIDFHFLGAWGPSISF